MNLYKGTYLYYIYSASGVGGNVLGTDRGLGGHVQTSTGVTNSALVMRLFSCLQLYSTARFHWRYTLQPD